MPVCPGRMLVFFLSPTPSVFSLSSLILSLCYYLLLSYSLSLSLHLSQDAQGRVVELEVHCCSSNEAAEKPKAFIHWVSEPQKCEIRLYERL